MRTTTVEYLHIVGIITVVEAGRVDRCQCRSEFVRVDHCKATSSDANAGEELSTRGQRRILSLYVVRPQRGEVEKGVRLELRRIDIDQQE